MIEASFGLFVILWIIIPIIIGVIHNNINVWIIFVAIVPILMIPFIPSEEIFDHTKQTEVYSTAGSYNSITGVFTLGSGYINSKEMYAVNVFDGAYIERFYIPVTDTKRIYKKELKGKAIYNKPICKYKNRFIFKKSDKVPCSNTKGILEIPENTIVKQMNFN